MEDPYMTADERDAQSIDYNSLLDQRVLLNQMKSTSIVSLPEFDPESFDASLAVSFDRSSYQLHVPLSFIDDLFKRFVSVGQRKIETEVYFCDEEEWFTSTIVDSTGEKFHSGLIGEEVKVMKKSGATMATPLHEAEVKVVDGRVYYRNPKIATHAAAARAIDCYICRRASRRANNNDKLSKIRLCMEDPYMTADGRDAQSIDYKSLLARRNRTSSITTCFDDASFEEDTYSLASKNHDEIIGKQSKLSTMGRIAEIWTNHEQSSRSEESGAEDLQSPSQIRLDNILAWYKHVNKSPKTYDDAVALANLCKRMLGVLGQSNKDQNGVPCTNIISSTVSKGAEDIWDRLCLLQTEFGASFLDIDTCNTYLTCHDNSDLENATKGEVLLACMANQEEYGELSVMLPCPNVDTYNAVMSLWSRANVDTRDAKNGVNRVYTLLQDTRQTSLDAPKLQPTVETFRILIAVNSKTDDGSFSFSNAKSCLDQIKHLSESDGDSFRPDLSIYNAALSKRNRVDDNTYKPAWLWNGRAFDDGFVDGTEVSNAEGLDVEEWCKLMETNSIAGDIETFEAVIQTWIDSGTLDGLVSSCNNRQSC
jgi:hypothetical protein